MERAYKLRRKSGDPGAGVMRVESVQVRGDSEGNLNEASPATKRRLKIVEQTFRRHHRLLVGWLAKKLGDEATAKDVAQEAFLRVWRSAHKTEIDDPRALIFKTAANLAVNEFKARKRFYDTHVDPASTGYSEKIETIAADEPSPERIASARQDYHLCMKFIETLPDKVRAAFVKSRFEALTYREIAEELGVSESSVEKYIIAALKGLRAAVYAPEHSDKVVSMASHARKSFYAGKRPNKKAGA